MKLEKDIIKNLRNQRCYLIDVLSTKGKYMNTFMRLIILILLMGNSLWAWQRVIPEYVRAWPKQVTVDKPDPILGDKLVWEYWIYSERFAKRFQGFALEDTDKELKDSPIQLTTSQNYNWH
jgi:hypothetical protein